MKKLMTVFLVSIIFLGFVSIAYSAEITLALNWRTSDKGLAFGEQVLPFSLTRTEIIDYPDGDPGEQTFTSNYTPGAISSFGRKTFFSFGVDFFLYKEKISLGFELGAGYFQRQYQGSERVVLKIDGEVMYDESYELEPRTTTIVPLSFFVVAKYKFNRMAGFRPYLGIGGGLNSTLFLDSNIEETFIPCGSFLAVAGVDALISGRFGTFIEAKYVKPFTKKDNFRDQLVVVVGIRFF